MLKQMLENNLAIKIVSWDSEDLYRESLNLCDVDHYDSLTKYLESLEDFREEYKELLDFE